MKSPTTPTAPSAGSPTAAADAAHHLGRHAHAAWERHLQLMDDEPAYRAQLVAGTTAVLTVLGCPGP